MELGRLYRGGEGPQSLSPPLCKSNKWGLTKLKVEEYKEKRESNLLNPDEVNVKRSTMHGPLSLLYIF
jgi:hypothetical protein